MRWPPVIFVYRPYFLATWPRTMSFSGVISPPGTRGTTEYVPPRWMLARKRSLVSWMVVCSTTFSFHRLARIEATAGLQISQPWPWPWARISSSNDWMRLILTISNSSCRVQAKCSHRALLTFLPDALIAALNRSVTSGRQPPQPVPAFVHSLISSTEVRFLSRMASQIWPLLTLLHEQTWVSLGMVVRAAPALLPSLLPSSNSPGGIASGLSLLASIDSCPYSEASPTRMPPSSRLPSRLNSSFLYDPLNGSSIGDRPGLLVVGEAVAEAGHVHAHQLELGGHVGALEDARPGRSGWRRRSRPSRSRARPGRRSCRRTGRPRRWRRCRGRRCAGGHRRRRRRAGRPSGRRRGPGRRAA